MTQPEATPAPAPIDRLWRYYEQHEHAVDIVFFAGGFLFDVFTLSRVDSWLNIVQQVVYLAAAAAILLHIFFDEGKPARRLEGMSKVKRWYFEYRAAAVHFLLGGLLSVYTLFFFKSSSVLVSFAFLLFLVLVLVVNESKHFKRLGLPFKFALLSVCLLSFSAIVVPVVIGSIGVVVFLLSMLVGMHSGGPHRSAHPDPRPGAQPAGEPADCRALRSGADRVSHAVSVPADPAGAAVDSVHRRVSRGGADRGGYRLSHEAGSWRFWRARRPVLRGPARRSDLRVLPHLLARPLFRPGDDALVLEAGG